MVWAVENSLCFQDSAPLLKVLAALPERVTGRAGRVWRQRLSVQ